MKYCYVGGKKWPEMVKQWPFMSHKFSFFFLTKLKKWKQNQIVIYVIVFDLIEISIDWAHQNDCQNLSFVKYTGAVVEKMTRNSFKMPNS